MFTVTTRVTSVFEPRSAASLKSMVYESPRARLTDGMKVRTRFPSDTRTSPAIMRPLLSRTLKLAFRLSAFIGSENVKVRKPDGSKS